MKSDRNDHLRDTTRSQRVAWRAPRLQPLTVTGVTHAGSVAGMTEGAIGTGHTASSMTGPPLFYSAVS